MAKAEICCTLINCDRPLLAVGLCAKHYHRRRAGKPLETKCENCGMATERPRFCSVDCSSAARDRRNGVLKWHERYPAPKCHELRTCQVCAKPFSRQRRGRDSFACCSRECGFSLIRLRGERQRQITEAKRQFANWAKADRISGFKTKIDLLRHRIARKSAPCPTCGRPVGHAKFKRYCSPQCYRVDPELVRRSRRTTKARRRALLRGSQAERFDPLDVLERDGWRCHICGRRTPKRLRGTHEDRAPELDHIVPLARGGAHTRRNTACACRKCNLAKSDKPLGQLILIG